MPNEPAKVHIMAQPVERFDQVTRYMRRHGGAASFIGQDGVPHVLTLASFKDTEHNRYFRRNLHRISLEHFNTAREEGLNQ